MKYKILKGTETFKKLWALRKKMSQVDKVAHKILDRFKVTQYRPASNVLSGGISTMFMKTPPLGWKPVNGGYFPKRHIKANYALLKEIEALPIIKKDELNDIVGFIPQFIGRTYAYCVGMNWKKNYCLMEMNPDAAFKPNADMVEITVSEYNKLSK